ncbi:hypothetical protein Lesp01_72470 [Lentzea sp. NBRC 102530]|nr:hypothetical protein Lesp01_72470 [Lentzea sp. NBRC 102530]
MQFELLLAEHVAVRVTDGHELGGFRVEQAGHVVFKRLLAEPHDARTKLGRRRPHLMIASLRKRYRYQLRHTLLPS